MRLSLIVSLLISIFLISEGYVMFRDIEMMGYRAQQSTNAQAMLTYMEAAKSGMEYHGMIHEKNLTELNSSINSIITRLEMIIQLPQNNLVYQTVLNDTRLIIRDLWGPSLGHLWDEYWYLFLIIIGIFIRWAAVIDFTSSDFIRKIIKSN